MTQDSTKQLELTIQKHKNLSKTKIQVETELKSLEAEHQKLLSEATEKYGVNSLDELRNLFILKSEENKKKIGDFSDTIALIENKINEINKGL